MGSFCNPLGEVMESQPRLQKQMSSPLASAWREDAAWPRVVALALGYSVLSSQVPLETSVSPHFSSEIFLAASSLCGAMFWGVPGTPLFSSVPVHFKYHLTLKLLSRLLRHPKTPGGLLVHHLPRIQVSQLGATLLFLFSQGLGIGTS